MIFVREGQHDGEKHFWKETVYQVPIERIVCGSAFHCGSQGSLAQLSAASPVAQQDFLRLYMYVPQFEATHACSEPLEKLRVVDFTIALKNVLGPREP